MKSTLIVIDSSDTVERLWGVLEKVSCRFGSGFHLVSSTRFLYVDEEGTCYSSPTPNVFFRSLRRELKDVQAVVVSTEIKNADDALRLVKGTKRPVPEYTMTELIKMVGHEFKVKE